MFEIQTSHIIICYQTDFLAVRDKVASFEVNSNRNGLQMICVSHGVACASCCIPIVLSRPLLRCVRHVARSKLTGALASSPQLTLQEVMTFSQHPCLRKNPQNSSDVHHIVLIHSGKN